MFTDGADITYTPTADEVQLTTDIGNIWANFIRNGNPNLPLKTPAPLINYDQTADVITSLNEPDSYTENHQRVAQCDMWDKLGFFW